MDKSKCDKLDNMKNGLKCKIQGVKFRYLCVNGEPVFPVNVNTEVTIELMTDEEAKERGYISE